MISQVSEKTMHAVRWVLAIGWLTLIASLLFDPISPIFTDPSNTWSPFHIHLDKPCVTVQNICVPHQTDEYGMGARIFWAMVLPIGISIILVLGHEFWRRICPLYFFSQIPRALKIQRKVKNPETGKLELAGVSKDSWLGRNYLYLQVFLFFVGLNIRILFANGSRPAMATFLLGTIASAIVVGYLFKGRSWCQYICPMAPVQMLYTGPRGLLGSDSHTQPAQTITQSTCRSVDSTGVEKSACVSCQSPCFDIDAERSYWEGITKPDQKLVFYTYFGLMLGFYCFYFLYSGNWEYYYSGVWTHEPEQLTTLFKPGFYIFGQVIPIPKVIASPLTIGVFAAGSYFVCQTLENLYRGYLKHRNKLLSEEQILHVCFVLCTFVSFNVFFMFGGRPNISLLPGWVILVINSVIIFLSSLWLYRSLTRSKERYNRESLASSLRRQLNKLAIDWSKWLEGRSLQDLLPDEVYVLAKVLPGFSRSDRMSVYKGVLQDALETGKVKSADSLEMLKDMRQELNITEEEHYSLLEELGIEDPSLLNVEKQRSVENKLRLESYRKALELLVLEGVEQGLPLSEAFERKQKQIMALRQEYAITSAEQEQVLAEMFNQDGALIRTAQALLKRLQDLAVQCQALNNLVPNPQAAVYGLLRSTVREKQSLITTQLLSLLEILRTTPESETIAAEMGVLSASVIQEVLHSQAEDARWHERLTPRLIQLLLQAEGNVTQTPMSDELREVTTRLSAIARTVLPGDRDNLRAQREVVTGVLLELLQDLDPMVQSASLYAMHQVDPTVGFQQAHQILNRPSSPDPILRETAERLVRKENPQAGALQVPTLVLQVRSLGHTERKAFQKSAIRVGRSLDNDVVLPDNRVSRQHAIFYLDEKGVTVKDLGSGNGLRVGKTHFYNEQRSLKSGDLVRFSAGDDLVIHVDWELRSLQDKTINQEFGTLEKLLWLYNSKFLAGLKPAALVELARNSRVRSFSSNEEICHLGTPAKELMLVIDGEARIFQTRNGRSSPNDMIPVGESIGALEVLTHSQHNATVIASGSKTRILAIESKTFDDLLSRDPVLARNLLALLSDRLQHSSPPTSPTTVGQF